MRGRHLSPEGRWQDAAGGAHQPHVDVCALGALCWELVHATRLSSSTDAFASGPEPARLDGSGNKGTLVSTRSLRLPLSLSQSLCVFSVSLALSAPFIPSQSVCVSRAKSTRMRWSRR